MPMLLLLIALQPLFFLDLPPARSLPAVKVSQ